MQPPKEMLATPAADHAASWGSTAGLARARLPAEVVGTVGGACRARIGIRRRRRNSKLGAEPFSELCRKVVLCVTEDWFVLSHFQPLIAVLREVAHAVVVITRSSGRLGEIEALGARVIDFDFRRSSSHPVREAQSAWSLARILEAEDADVVHLVAMKPVVLGGLALKLVPSCHVVLHMTGLGLLGFGTGRLLQLYRAGALRLMASTLRRPTSYLLVENPDDLALLRTRGSTPDLGLPSWAAPASTPRPSPRCRRPGTTRRWRPSSAA